MRMVYVTMTILKLSINHPTIIAPKHVVFNLNICLQRNPLHLFNSLWQTHPSESVRVRCLFTLQQTLEVSWMDEKG